MTGLYYNRLYQIGIRCLAATGYTFFYDLLELYQIGIRCLAATNMTIGNLQFQLYQIGIRCLAATRLFHFVFLLYYIRLELDV